MSKLNGFEYFRYKHRRDVPTAVTINYRGYFILNRSATINYIKEYRYCNFLFNKNKNLIGIKLLDEPNDFSYKINRKKANPSAFICGQCFLNHIEVGYKESKKYQLEYHEKEKMLIINLKKFIKLRKKKPI